VSDTRNRAIIEELTSLWRRVLRLPSVQLFDNFFNLGGDSSLAVVLFNEISKHFGRDLPPVMIYQAPTIAALAEILEAPSVPQVAPLLMLKEGSKEPPVFLAHGLGGSAIDFYQVVRHMQTERRVYGIQSAGVDRMEETLQTIEEIAQSCLNAVRDLQPHGPYLLAGFSLGGLVVFEMARRLFEQGQRVALLAMFEAYPHVSQLSFEQRVLIAMRMGRRKATKLMGFPLNETVLPTPSGNGAGASSAMQRARDSAYHALMRYRPKSYKGTIKFVRAQITTTFPSNPMAVWGGLAKRIDVETLPGDHLGIMTAHYAKLADALSRYLREVSLEDVG